MLDIKLIRETPELVRHSLERRNLHAALPDLERLIAIDADWRAQQGRCDELRARRNEVSQSIQRLGAGERQRAIDEMRQLKDALARLEAQVDALHAQRDTLLRALPNLIAPEVPAGLSDADNVEIARWGEPRALGFAPRDHLALGELTDTIDFERGAKLAGSGFYYLKREAALLEQALCAFAAASLMPAGFVPISTPDLARARVLEGIGFAPNGPEQQIYTVDDGDLCLIATAEITVGAYHAEEVLEAAQLPLRYLGFSHCFRREAGAHGRESRGLYRVHQFTKAEMFVLCTPEQAEQEHAMIRALEEQLLQALAIPYRVVDVCAGDLGAPAAKKYDLEAWMPGRGCYGEVTSCSNCTDFQSRRLNIRWRPDPQSSPRFVHMLNGTALAVSRTLLAIYENYQQADGSVEIPSALRPWLGGLSVIPARA
ncbi:MAG: serine--tRNA ligase [Proteobacteria bacterium]|nr:serine--tRNA ligase [Pseudomonadota bacterium]